MSTATLRQGAHILALIGQKNDDKDDLTALVETGLLADLLEASNVWSVDRNEFRKLLGLCPVVPDVIILSVDYTRPWEEMIASGKYDRVNKDLTVKRFPIVGEGIVEYQFRYFHFKRRHISSKTAVELIKKEDCENPWEPAKIEHSLVYGENFPEEQYKFPIVALGSVGEVDDDPCVSYLGEDGSGRNLNLARCGGGFDGRCRFLAVRKVSRTSVS